MNLMADHKPIKREIASHFKHWTAALGLGWPEWVFAHQWMEAEGGEDGGDAASTNAMWEYHQAAFRWHLPTLAQLSPAAREAVVVHELCHVMLAPMESKVDDAHRELCEHTIERLSRCLLDLLSKRGG